MRAGADRIVAGALGQADHPQLQRLRFAPPAAGQAHHLQRAATDIGQDAVGGGDAAQHALGGVFRFLDARQHADRHAGHPLGQGGDEIGAIAGVAHGGGGQHFERLGAHGAGYRVVAVQHGEGLRHAVVVQPAGGGQASAQAEHRFFVEDRDRVAAVAFEHHQADRVGPQIHHGAAGQLGGRSIGHGGLVLVRSRVSRRSSRAGKASAGWLG